MKEYIKRAAAFGVLLIIIAALIPTAYAEKMTYSDTKNSGVRDEVCISLEGTGAEDYYAGEYSFESLSALSESELLISLRSLMTATHTYRSTYADSKNYADKTDCRNGDGKIVLLYTSSVVEFSDFIGSGSIGWNREHVWPKSLGGFDNDGAGADLHHIRPDDVTTNAKRGNLKYGNVQSGSEAKGSSLVGGAVGGTYSGGYFEPLDNVKGDVARICLYVYARYGGELSKCSSITNVFESVDVLLEWCESDPVDTWEMGRNEVVEKIQGNRNVFIDYPEYAFLLFGREVPENMTTPSGMAQKKEVTAAEETTAEITAETTAEITVETAEEITEVDVITTEEIMSLPETSQDEAASPAQEGCASLSGALPMIVLIHAVFVFSRKRSGTK